MISRFQVTLGVAALFAALLGALWCGVEWMAIAMSYGAGAGGNAVAQQHISRTVFITPALAVVLGVAALFSRRHATSHRASLWLLVPAVVLAILTILVALSAL